MTSDQEPAPPPPKSVRETLSIDIACVGFGPAMGGFLTTLSRRLSDPGASTSLSSRAAPGMPLQVVCYERADSLGFGVSGVATKAASIRASLPGLEAAKIPLAAPIAEESLVYLLDPLGASRRSKTVRLLDSALRAARLVVPVERDGVRMPFLPRFLRKRGGMVLSIGQFNEWVAAGLMASGNVQIWPGTPAAAPLVENGRVFGVRLVDQGTDARGRPGPMFLPGMDIRASLTVVGDGPVGAVGQRLDERFGVPMGHRRTEWALGMKAVIDLREGVNLAPGTVLHTFGFPEPEIFGFLYVLAERVASVGIFVPSSLRSPVRTAYRYLQHFMLHPYLWHYLQGGTLRSWGAKTLHESGRSGEPWLAGDGFARIGEGSGSTNVLVGSGVDEAWATGVQLASAVIELLEAEQPFTRENLERAYITRRRKSFVEAGVRAADGARDGFHHGFLRGLFGMAVAGLSQGRLRPFRGAEAPPVPTLAEYFEGIPAKELDRIVEECALKGVSVHDALLERSGWPPIPYDGKLLVSHQDALLLGGKVQAPSGYADHVVVRNPGLCHSCRAKTCIEACSGQALTRGPGGAPSFDRDKCVHCGACQWNCAALHDGEVGNIELLAGTGGLHSSEN